MRWMLRFPGNHTLLLQESGRFHSREYRNESLGIPGAGKRIPGLIRYWQPVRELFWAVQWPGPCSSIVQYHRV